MAKTMTESCPLVHEAPFPTDGPNQESDRAKRLMAMGQMAASLAHEIRNPLGSMELYCSLLKRDLESEPDLKLLAERIHSGIKTLDRIISNCLQFARDVVPQRKQITSIPDLLDDVLDYVRPKAEELDIDLSYEILGEGIPSVDKYQINQALLNLLINAIDAVADRISSDIDDKSNEKPLNRQVRLVSDLRDSNNWILTIVDTGTGIRESIKDKIFDPFVSTKKQGSGLGLAIVHSIVTAHGGGITITSEPNTGTSVSVILPLGDGIPGE